jgi:hypothetical protein
VPGHRHLVARHLTPSGCPNRPSRRAPLLLASAATCSGYKLKGLLPRDPTHRRAQHLIGGSLCHAVGGEIHVKPTDVRMVTASSY